MNAELEDFQCDANQLGRFRINAELVRQPELGLGLALMGFTPIRVFPSADGDWLDVLGLSPLFASVEEGCEIPVYRFIVVEHEDDGMIEPSINCPAPMVIELHMVSPADEST